jgi:hypothetical protein
MGKLFGLILIVLGVWIGLEVYEKGVDGACGGVFAWFATPIGGDGRAAYDPSGRAVQPRGSLAQRVGAKVQSDIDAGAHRDGVDDEQDND